MEPYMLSPDRSQRNKPLVEVAMLSLFSFALQTSGDCRTWQVKEDGTGDAPTVQAGIDSAAGGDTVLVSPGHYFEAIEILGRNITVRGEAGSGATTLDASGLGRPAVTFSEVSGEALLAGFTITGGEHDGFGGGIYCTSSASPHIRENRIIGNKALWGGGLHMGDGNATAGTGLASPTIEENLFEDNVAERQGGGLRAQSAIVVLRNNGFVSNSTLIGDGGGVDISLRFGTATVSGNEFRSNLAMDKGGGLNIGTEFNPVSIADNLFVKNVARGSGPIENGSGGGIYAIGIKGTIENNTFAENEGFGETRCGGGGILIRMTFNSLKIIQNILAFNAGCGISCWDNSTATVEDNLVWENTGDASPEFSGCPTEWMDLSIVGDPQFCGIEAGDYSVSASSPALAGANVIGAFETPGCPGVLVLPTTWGAIKTRY
jgi:hypothetical protein